MARKRARRNEGTGSITKYKTRDGHRWQAKLPHGLTDPVTGKGSAGGFETRDEAQAWLDATIPAAKAVAGSPAGTLGEWLAAWLAGVRADGASATHRRYRQAVETHVRPRLGDIPLRQLTRAKLSDWLDALRAAGVSASERGRAVRYLRVALGAAVRRDLIPSNPAAGVRAPKHVKAEKVPFTPDQARAVLAAAKAVGLYPAIRLWLDAGLRPAEMFALPWEDVAPDCSAVTVRRAVDEHTGKVKLTKTDRVRTVPLSEPARLALLPVRGKPSDLVMPAPRGGMFVGAANFRRTVWLPLLLRAGVATRRGKHVDQHGLTPYALRHTMASVALSAGLSIVAVSRRLGHAKVSTTLDEYGHLMPDDAAKVADEMGRVFGELG